MKKLGWLMLAFLLQSCVNFSIDNINGSLVNNACDLFSGKVTLDGKAYDFSTTKTQPAIWSYGTASYPAREEILVDGVCKVGLTDFKINQQYNLTPYVLQWKITVEDSISPKLVLTQGITR
jgi:hypothetical protein